MSHANTLKSLAALLLAGAALVGCGGGDAEPPPPPVGNPPAGPDTTAPSVTISNNVSTPTATGPVTFTFVFSEDVGVSFDGTDITVDGGSPGAFTRVDGSQATLVVTPTPNVAGTMTVSVAAGRFTDIAGNANTASASGSKDYVVPPPQPPTGTVLANFDAVSPPFLGAEGGEGSAVEAGPAGGSGNALKVLRSGGQPYALAIVTLPSNIPLEATRKTISARVYSPTAGIPMVIKLEKDGDPGTNSGEVQANETVVVGWQTLTWTINAVNTSYSKLVLLPNLGTVDAPPGKAYYFDDITLLGTASGGGGGSGTVLANFDAVSPPFLGAEGGEGSAVEAGPAGGSGNALKVLRSGGQPYALAIVTLPSNIPLEATRKTISARVYSPTAGIPMVIKLEKDGDPGTNSGEVQANETVVVGWQTLTWTINAVNTSYSKLVLLPNLGTVDAPPGKAYYFDDITLLGTASGGGGGSGTFAGGIFSSDYSGNLGAGTAKSDKNGNVGFFLDPRLFANKAFEDGSVCGTACNPGGVPNFYYGIGKLTPVLTDAYFGGFVNAPGNTTADASAFAKIKLKFWGDAESWEKPNFTAQVDVIVQGPTNAACTNGAGRPEIIRTVPAQKIGAGSEYVILKTDFVLSESCGGAYTVNSVWTAIGAVVVRLSGTNLQYVNSVASSPVSFPTFINIGPISFIN
jgi:Bacterial Ig-like domain